MLNKLSVNTVYSISDSIYIIDFSPSGKQHQISITHFDRFAIIGSGAGRVDPKFSHRSTVHTSSPSTGHQQPTDW